jgi:hypothetical protein
MPTGFLTDLQRRQYSLFESEPTTEQLVCCFHPDVTDRPIIGSHRGDSQILLPGVILDPLK